MSTANAENIMQQLRASPLERLLNVTIVGPGMWFLLHFAACMSKAQYVTLASLYRNILLCTHCRDHLASSLVKYNLSDYEKLPDGIAKHAWALHNDVAIVNNNIPTNSLKPVVDCQMVVEWFKLLNKPILTDEDINTIRNTPHLTRYLDMNYIGPGIWYVIHCAAAVSNRGNTNTFYDSVITLVGKALIICPPCREQLNWYITNDSIEGYRQMDDGFARHAWALHNNISIKLNRTGRVNKELITSEHAVSWYKHLIQLIIMISKK